MATTEPNTDQIPKWFRLRKFALKSIFKTAAIFKKILPQKTSMKQANSMERNAISGGWLYRGFCQQHNYRAWFLIPGAWHTAKFRSRETSNPRLRASKPGLNTSRPRRFSAEVFGFGHLQRLMELQFWLRRIKTRLYMKQARLAASGTRLRPFSQSSRRQNIQTTKPGLKSIWRARNRTQIRSPGGFGSASSC